MLCSQLCNIKIQNSKYYIWNDKDTREIQLLNVVPFQNKTILCLEIYQKWRSPVKSQLELADQMEIILCWLQAAACINWIKKLPQPLSTYAPHLVPADGISLETLCYCVTPPYHWTTGQQLSNDSRFIGCLEAKLKFLLPVRNSNKVVRQKKRQQLKDYYVEKCWQRHNV